jgi:hypothetical protein
MDTRVVWVAVISIALGGLIWQMAGFSDLFVGDAPGDEIEASEELQSQAEESAIRDDFEADTRANQGTLVGSIISGASAVFDMGKFVLYLPGALMALMMPAWFAQPVGHLAAILISIGLIQFITGRILK